MTGSSDVVVIGSLVFIIGVIFSTDAFRGLLLFNVCFGVEGVVFGVTFGLGSDFILAEPFDFNIISMSL